ncbi:MAG: tetratricopeptide repeat protein [Candidatus Eisenbacteria bacterium]|nr:tetratricopeptide repeat protein [Candidatus Eisenbacteria bacterium]
MRSTGRARAVPCFRGRLLLVAFAFVMMVLSGPANARAPENQSEVESRVELARQAAAAGAVDEAVRIYEEILKSNPDNDRAFWGLARLYSSSDEYSEKLLPLLTERLARMPNDVQTKMELGQALARAGEFERAHALWSEVLQTPAADASLYSEIGALEIRNKMYEQALDTFLTGRAAFRSRSIFSQELAHVYSMMGDFGHAIDECVVTVEGHGGAVPWAANMVEMMMSQGAARREIGNKVDEILKADDVTPEALSFAGSVFLVIEIPERALAAFLRADELAGGHGDELLEYGTMLRDQGLSEEAREAYLMVVERHPGTASAARAGIAAAGILAMTGRPSEAVAELRAVADAFDASSIGAQAMFECARIELDDLNLPEDALATVGELRRRFGPRVNRMSDDATMIEVDANVRLGRYDEAYDLSEQLTGENTRSDIRERAMFSRGFVLFLKHDAGAAMEKFREMVEGDASGDLVNDALRLMLVIALAQEAENMAPVETLADAHAARIAGDAPASRALLEEVAGESVNAALEAEALLLLGELAADDGDLERAIGYYDRIILGTEGMTARAEAMMRKGDLLADGLDRKAEALDAYGAILELPLNPLSGEARRKIDSLRRGEGVPG